MRACVRACVRACGAFTPLAAASHLLQPARFNMCLVGAVCKGGINCGSAYFNSSVGIGAKVNRDLLEAIHAGLRQLAGPWLIGADWNCTPAELTATGWLKLVGGPVCRHANPGANFQLQSL